MAVFVNLPAPGKKQVLFIRDKEYSGITLADACATLCDALVMGRCVFYALYYYFTTYGMLLGRSVAWRKMTPEQKLLLRTKFGFSGEFTQAAIVPESVVYLFQRCLYVHTRKLAPEMQEWVDHVLTPMFRHCATARSTIAYAKSQGYTVGNAKGRLPWIQKLPAFDGCGCGKYGTLSADLRSYFNLTDAGEAKVNELRYFVEMGDLYKWLATKPVHDVGIPAPELVAEVEKWLAKPKPEPKPKAAPEPKPEPEPEPEPKPEPKIEPMAQPVIAQKHCAFEQVDRKEYLKELHAKVRASIDAIKGSTPCYCDGKFFSAPEIPLWDSAPSYSSRFKAAHEKASEGALPW